MHHVLFLIDPEPICSLSASTSTSTKLPEAVLHHVLFLIDLEPIRSLSASTSTSTKLPEAKLVTGFSTFAPLSSSGAGTRVRAFKRD